MQSPGYTKDSDLYRAFERKRYGLQTCFLCSRRLTKTTRSDEHVFPKWLQERFGLWDQQLVLLNGSSIPYRQLVIPCCAECNMEDLSQLENVVRVAFEKGAEAVRDLPLLTLFQWTGKIFYGLLYKEFFLRRNRADGSKATIVARKVLEQFKLHHFFLQSIKRPIEFQGTFPASIFVHRLQSPKDPSRQFNFRDLHHLLGLSIQLGEVGIIAVLQDGGVQAEGMDDTHRGYYELKLHPLQFAEMTAKTFYKATLMNRTPEYRIAEANGHIMIFQRSITGYGGLSIYDKWDQAHYAWVLSEHTRYAPDVISPTLGQVCTWLRNERGEFIHLDVERDVWP